MTDFPGLPPGEPWRLVESDRQAAAERLRVALDEGRLDRVEYQERLRTAETAPSLAQLQQVLADLPAPSEPVLLQIGELTVTRSTVFTPAGPIPLRGSQWTLQNQWLVKRTLPTWAIITAAAGFLVLFVFSLLFLLVRETEYHGTVDVTVSNAGRQYVARIPVHQQEHVSHVYQQVNYVRSLAVG